MTLSGAFTLCVLVSGSLCAHELSHPLRPAGDDAPAGPRPAAAAPDTMDLLAVMAEFQEDADDRTTGTGRFDMSATTDPIIDPPPRNRQYFEDHLRFLENYFRKVSGGKLILRGRVLDGVFTLPGRMESYSPPKNGSAAAVGRLAVDTWTRVDSSGLVADFSMYECFVIFHAGAGRDIDLVSILGYDPTPFDIPSLYLGPASFREFYGPGYQGIPVAGGGFHITNTIVMPETESRLLPGVSGDVLLELGINGLLCASVGSRLGLPDLFDTRTGRSGIGRFGLMDGQAIFSFSGVFPPEPSAWEKYWLGWTTPVVLGTGVHTLSLPAAAEPDVVYRIPVSGSEYYLVENRNRDPQGNGQTVWTVFNGVPSVRTFSRDTSGFNAFSVSALEGVVTEVEDPDWSLPGATTSGGEFFDGGILIWHVDESVILAGAASNRVNADPERRGVDVEEADGSQDIGQAYEFLSRGSGSEEGTPLDFWFEGNSAPVFRGEFSETSHPPALANTGARSHVSVRGFTPRGALMQVTVRVGDDDVEPLEGFPRLVGEEIAPAGLTVADVNGDGSPDILAATTGVVLPSPTSGGSSTALQGEGKIYAWRSDGGGAVFPFTRSDGLIARSGGSLDGFSTGPAAGDLDGNGVPEILGVIRHTAGGSSVAAFAATDANADSLADLVWVRVTAEPVTGPVPAGDSVIPSGMADGTVLLTGPDGSARGSLQAAPGRAAVKGVTLLDPAGVWVAVAEDGTVARVDVTSLSVTRTLMEGAPAGPAVCGLVGPSTSPRIAVVSTDGRLHLFESDLSPVAGFPVRGGGEALHGPALADVNGDGLREIVFFAGPRVYAYNHAGAAVDFFPVAIPTGSRITSHPVIADVNGDDTPEIVAVAEDGYVAAYDSRGGMARGFPLQASWGIQSVAVFARPVGGGSLQGRDLCLAVGSSFGESVAAWKTGSTASLLAGSHLSAPWPQFQRDGWRRGYAPEVLTPRPLSSAFFPGDRAYNWPNPVYDGTTFIRYFVRENARVTVTVYDLAGDFVAEFPGPGVGGVDNEVAWDVRNVQSGVYFARIQAEGGGASGTAVIRVAVVK
ncbi:MAG: FG-GAP-like repeat-containing protein [Bacteroidota bacterium]